MQTPKVDCNWEIIQLESGIQKVAGSARNWTDKMAKPSGNMSQEEFLEKYVALLVLFSMSGTSIYGSLNEGMTGDPTLLIVKAIL